MASSPRVSIIVPVYHSDEFISQCIESILGQTYENFEVIFVIDDFLNSMDYDIVSDAADEADDKRICIDVSSLKTTCAHARNRGIELSRGEYIAFCDSDDWWEPRKLEMQVAYMDSHPEIEWCWGYALHHRGENVYSECDSWEHPKPHNMIPFQTVMARRGFLDKISKKYGSIFNEKLKQIDDFDLYVRIRNYPNYHTTEVLSHYRIHEHGITSSTPKYATWVNQTRIIVSRGIYKHIPFMAYILANLIAIDSIHIFERCWRWVLRRPKK